MKLPESGGVGQKRGGAAAERGIHATLYEKEFLTHPLRLRRKGELRRIGNFGVVH